MKNSSLDTLSVFMTAVPVSARQPVEQNSGARVSATPTVQEV